MGIYGQIDGEAVADSGPIIHLREIGRLSLLRVFATVHIPDEVWRETVEQKRVSRYELEQASLLQRHKVSQVHLEPYIIDHRLAHLHSGELAALYLCSHVTVPIILTDDLAVRQVAKRLRLIPVGALGIVVEAYRQRLLSLSQAEESLLDLYHVSSLFVTKAVVELAIKQLHERQV